MTSENLIEVQDLSFYRGDKCILSSINLSIPRGKITAIMGPSGCGKTTLLSLMGGLLKPHSGEVNFDGVVINQLKRQALYALRREIGVLFQSGALFTDLSVYENVAFPIREHANLPESMVRNIVMMKLEAVGLRGAQSLMPQDLSGGMARRVALARSIALDPRLMMYDEPFTGQDPISMAMLVKLIKQLNELLGMTTVIVSHDVDETLAIADQVYLLAKGQVIASGSADSIRHSDNPMVKQFILGLADGEVPFHYPARAYKEELLDDSCD